MRSKTEARWAYFLTAIGVKWEYEPDFFEVRPDVFYLPDFYLPDLDCFLEIKPREYLPTRQSPTSDLCRITGKVVFTAYGSPKHIDPLSAVLHQADEFMGSQGLIPSFPPNGDGSDSQDWFAGCSSCGKIRISSGGRRDLVECDCGINTFDAPSLRKSITMAAESAENQFRDKP